LPINKLWGGFDVALPASSAFFILSSTFAPAWLWVASLPLCLFDVGVWMLSEAVFWG
jgi:hypothetical protein